MISAARATGLYVEQAAGYDTRMWHRGFHARIISPLRELAEINPNAIARAAMDAEKDGPFKVTLPSGEEVRVAVVDIAVLATDVGGLLMESFPSEQ